jgi:hypothetical protein
VSCPEAIRNCAEMFKKLINPHVRDTLTTDTLLLHDEADGHDSSSSEDANPQDDYNTSKGKEMLMPSEIYHAFRMRLRDGFDIPLRAKFPSTIRLKGLSYAVNNTHEGNSGVFLKECPTPCCIKKIIRFPQDVAGHSTWIAVCFYKQAIVRTDPYRRYPHLQASLWGRDMESSLEVAPLDAIDTHFAKSVIRWEGKDVSVIVSLSRVCDTSSFPRSHQ